ncbi:MAG: hypothetical protein ACFFCS_01040 [Candidatus Hodarchaeota archaeon]
MPYIINTITYPSHKQGEIVKKFLSLVKTVSQPEELFEQVASPITMTNEGVKGTIIYLVKKGKLEETLEYLNGLYFNFTEIEGCEFSLEVCMTWQEALKTAKIEIPS